MRLRKEVGIHESLVHYHQVRKIVLVALLVDPSNRCLVIKGVLPNEEHNSFGAYKGILPFVEGWLTRLNLRKKQIYQMARVYDPTEDRLVEEDSTAGGDVEDPAYVVARVDVQESHAVASGEWLASVTRASALGDQSQIVVGCAQLFLGNLPSWKSHEEDQPLAA